MVKDFRQKCFGIAMLLFLGVLFVLSPWVCSAQSGIVSVPRRWGLAAGGVLTAVNNIDFDRLKTNRSVADEKKLLDEWWDIRDRASALSMMAWIRNEGHTKEYRDIEAQISKISVMDYNRFRGQVAARAGEQAALSVNFVHNNSAIIADKGLVAWDFGRLINVARWCYTCGYITEEEAWSNIMLASRKIQATYRSWDEYGDHYILGRRFWQPGKDQTNAINVLKWLKDNPNSPWKRLPWGTPLTGG